MSSDRETTIVIGGEEHELLFTTRTTKEIAARYDRLESLGDRLLKAENFKIAIDEVIWLITLLDNQSKLVYNLRHKNYPIQMITE